jgi:L-ribulose-5-phosphate 4-epimerase
MTFTRETTSPREPGSALAALRREVCDANRALPALGLVTLTWGNISGFLPELGLFAIKPSGVPYADLTPDSIVVLDLDCRVASGSLKPSTDAPTHAALYRAFAPRGIRGITHTHSRHATAFAQARRELPCLGTTHADHFHGPIPVTTQLTASDMTDYEAASGRAIIARFKDLDPASIPGVLLAGHAPFTWGKSATDSLNNAVALEAIAAIALDTYALAPTLDPPSLHPPTLEPHILAKHHARKHGQSAYYGQ